MRSRRFGVKIEIAPERELITDFSNSRSRIIFEAARKVGIAKLASQSRCWKCSNDIDKIDQNNISGLVIDSGLVIEPEDQRANLVGIREPTSTFAPVPVRYKPSSQYRL